MKKPAVLRISGDICLYFGLLSLFKTFRSFSPLMGLFLLLGAAGLFVSVRIPKAVLRLPFALLPALCFLWLETVTGYVIFAIPMAYYFLTVLLGRFGMLHWEYLNYFRVMCVPGSILLAIAVIWGTANLSAALFALCFLLFGILTLRKLRMEADMPLRWKGMNLMEVLLPTGAAAGLCYIIYLLVTHSRRVMEVVAAPVVGTLVAITRVSEVLSEAYIHWRYHPEEETAEAAAELAGVSEASADLPELADTPGWLNRIRVPWKLLLILAVLAIAVWAILKLLRLHGEEEQEEVFYEEGQKTAVRRRKRRKKEKTPTNAEAVRRIYRDYMALLSFRGVTVYRDSTSRDLLEVSGDMLPPEPNAGLRAIYLKARYGRGESVTDDERLRAEGYLEALRKSGNV